ncbi:hypothetical protein FHX77_000753 [Bifidobacterium commune]|uniref:Modulator of FtsH protease n=2 Tax=Bifidobacterium commune TaxID=1505727 RepID=A0A1C4H0P3_9BIFI|nr:hypothetical protein [Bifidobacterium commune]SCC78342.1 hypothetical protein GA0061077_0217 [Bifidobacterium commune]
MGFTNRPENNNSQQPYGQPAAINGQNYGQNYGQPPTANGQVYGQNYGQQQYNQYEQSQNPMYGSDQQTNYGQPFAQPQYQQQGYAYAGAATPTMTMNGQTVYSFERARHTSTTQAYGEMTLGLLLTALVAVITQVTGALDRFLMTTGMMGWIGLAVVQVVIAVMLGVRIQTMKVATARTMFYVYAALTGFTLASIFEAYSLPSIGIALGLCVAFFFVLTMISLTTKKDMLKAGPILMVALLVLLVGEIILMFIAPSHTTLMVTAALGLIIFAGLTMYDAQQTRAMFDMAEQSGDTQMIQRISIICALNLYLDFVNMFLYLLQLFGSNDD